MHDGKFDADRRRERARKRELPCSELVLCHQNTTDLMGFTVRLVAQTVCVWTDRHGVGASHSVVTDDGAGPPVDGNAPRFGKIECTVCTVQMSMSQG
jgi:hypothetical protein